mgnify:CR=1 FL=1
MKLADLRRLKMAIDTGNINLYHGSMTTAFVEAVNELLQIKEEAAIALSQLREQIAGIDKVVEGWSETL